MKTINRITNLKKLAVSFCAALVITTGSYTQPNPDSDINEVSASLVRLEEYMKLVEQTVRYEAPSVSDVDAYGKNEISYEIEKALENLEIIADNTEAAFKYKAPTAEDTKEVSYELERLDILANAIEESIRFKAPSVNDFPESDYVVDNSNDIILANENQKSDASVPANVQMDKPVYLLDNSKNCDKYFRSYTRNMNGKVLQVSYYQSNRASVWNKLWKLFTKKSSNTKSMGMKTIAAAYTTNVYMK